MTIRDMVARHSDYDETRDFIPTPPYATRVLYEEVCPELKAAAPLLSAWDPAAGHGHMTRVMEEYGHTSVLGTDIKGHKGIHFEEDFMTSTRKADVVITNPPYKLVESFVHLSLLRANSFVGMLVRIQFLESQGRYDTIFNKTPPTRIGIFSDRIPFKTGVVVKRAPKMFSHIWVAWDMIEVRNRTSVPRYVPTMWVPTDAQAKYQKDEDYEKSA